MTVDNEGLDTANGRLIRPRRRQDHEDAVFFRFVWASVMDLWHPGLPIGWI